MSNVTITKSSPADYIDNPAVDTRRTNGDSATDYRPVAPPPRDWRVIAAWTVGCSLLLLVMALLYGIFRITLCWGSYSDTCEKWRWIETWLPYVILTSTLVFGAAYFAVWFRGALVTIDQRRIENQRFSLLPDRFGNPTPVDLYAGLSPAQRFDSYFRLLELATELKRDTAPHELYPGSLNTLSIGGNSQTIAALPEPEDAIVLTPDDQWRKWLLKAPHLLIGGKTDAGKTTFETMLLGEYIDNGDQVLILDPHWQPGKWYGLPATSGIPAILALLPDLLAELTSRLEQYAAGKLTEEFDRLTVLIDEVPAIVSECIELTASGRPKIIDDRWPRFARKLGSEARKVGCRVILGSQSTFVQDLLINPQMRENYTRIGLGNLARSLIGSESDSKRKQALYDLLRGQSHPASMEYRGDYYVLDTSNVVALAERQMRPLARMYDSTTSARPEPSQELLGALLREPPLNNNGHTVAQSVSGLSSLSASVKLSTNGTAKTKDQTTDQRPEWDYAKKVAVLRILRSQGLTRNQARDRLSRIGQGFNNDDWTEARP